MGRRTKNRKETIGAYCQYLKEMKDRIVEERRKPGNYRYPQEILKQRKKKRNLEERAMEAIVAELKKISEMLKEPLIVKKKAKTDIHYNFSVKSKEVYTKGENIFYCILDMEDRIVATVCLIMYDDKIARGIAIRGPEDRDTSIDKGRNIAFARACFVFAEQRNSCSMQRKNKNSDIVKEEFCSKYKAQYMPKLTDYEKHLVTDNI